MDIDDTNELPVDLNNATNTAETQESSPAQEVGWSIDKGVERENNQDSVATATLNQVSEDEAQSFGVYAVADGMGGHEAGEVASKLAVRTAIRQLMTNVTEIDTEMPDSYQSWLESAVTIANQVVHHKAHEDSNTMGSTLVMAVVVGHDVHIVNVGDSRAYLISPDDIRQITHDQSFVQALLDKGVITPEQAATHPRRNVLLQSLGTNEQVSPDLFSETLDANESLLLCSDGVWNMLGDAEIARIVRAADTPNAACQALVDACNAAGGNDNIAAVLVRLGASSQPSVGNASVG
ncbi:MAG: Stp1/IreP family PP2C-type Ser/Thr phosphatase [Chloroflexota bacterium]